MDVILGVCISWSYTSIHFQIQFLLNSIHSFQILFYPDCAHPKWTVFVIVPQNLFMFWLFYRFYQQAYCSNDKKVEKLDKKVVSNGNGTINGNNNTNGNGTLNGNNNTIYGNGTIVNKVKNAE